MIKSENSTTIGGSSKSLIKTAKTINISITTMNVAPVEVEPPNI